MPELIGNTALKVVYDVDDVLWPLNARVFGNLGLDLNKDIVYNVFANPLLTPEERKAVIAAFKQTSTFKDIDFYPGAKEILDVEQFGATVRIHSHCYTEEIAKLKYTQIQKILPKMRPAFIKMTIISNNPNNKKIDADAFAFVDDNPYNIVGSKAPVNIVPRQPWNSTDEAAQVMTNQLRILIDTGWQEMLPELILRHQHCVIMAKNLKEVNQIIKQAVKIKQETKRGKI